MYRKLTLVLCTALAVSASAQSPLTPDTTEKANRLFDNGPKGTRLRCAIEPRKPFLDFAFRFYAGYVVSCPLREFEGKENTMLIFVRVTPEGGAPVVLGGAYKLPAVPPAMRDRRRSEVSTSGAFSVGEGQYLVEALVIDNRSRMCQRRWRIKAAYSRAERAVPVALKAHTVAPMEAHWWDGKMDASGVQLTVLLDAAPINPRALKLRAWDQAFLLASLSSVLQQTPCKSVRLVAFNLDQQREIFRQDRFDPSGFVKLSKALRDLELGTISARVLQRPQGRVEMLANLTNQEVTAEETSDAVIFLGPGTRTSRKIPKELLRTPETGKPQFFYFKYFPFWRAGSEFPDSIDYLAKARNGTIFKIHSPGELALAIQKMLRRLPRGDEETTRSR